MDAALGARPLRLHALANPDLLLREFFVEGGLLFLLGGQDLLAPLAAELAGRADEAGRAAERLATDGADLAADLERMQRSLQRWRSYRESDDLGPNGSPDPRPVD